MYSRIPFALFSVLVALAGCAQVDSSDGESANCSSCTNPDQPQCRGCLGAAEQASDPRNLPQNSPYENPAAADQLTLTQDTLDFAIGGDTRPANIDDTAGYPTAIITKIFKDLQAETPRPGFAVATGDYEFSNTNGVQSALQLDLYIQARSNFSNPEFPTMGNHECTGATA